VAWALNNITAPDAYSSSATLLNLNGVTRINIDVANQGIFWQLQRATGTGLFTEGSWDQEVFMAPGSRSLFRAGIVGARVRAAIPAADLPANTNQAIVTMEAA
jgi:hypothetical protein